MQKLDDELDRRFFVVVKDYLEVAGLSLNVGHGKYPLINIISEYRFGS
jgi:hypothetical protein